MRFATPVGALEAEFAADGAVTRLTFAGGLSPSPPCGERVGVRGCELDVSGSNSERSADTPAPTPPRKGEGLSEALCRYFEGYIAALEAIPVRTTGTPFQKAVWTALRAIPAGKTASYGEIARAVGQPGAAREVGQACNRNPVVLVTPCHRVIGADGALVGFGGGLPRKRWLLEHEGAISPEPPRLL